MHYEPNIAVGVSGPMFGDNDVEADAPELTGGEL